jgi:radical SAM/Cys-rich protein
MNWETVQQVIELLRASKVHTLDLTGGAPELNPHFRYLIETARSMNVRVIDRCNLTILEAPGQETLAPFLAANRVEIVASMPCYLQENVDAQRGEGVFAASIRGLQRLNALGYGLEDTGLVLNLVFNPQGPSLPPPQTALEADYKAHLQENYGLRFNQLYTLTNMPIQRFGSLLISKGQFHDYMNLLKSAHRQENLDTVMCRNLFSVAWNGEVYDCDFNQMLGIPLRLHGRPRVHIKDRLNVDLNGNPIGVADHCYGCTAGQGSSCGGALI